MKFYIGTSGWQYGDWREFYPKTLESWAFLPFYVHSFNSVEINVSFYRMVRKKTFEGWARGIEADQNFVFAAKLLNHFTRIRKLKLEAGDEEKLQEFLDNASGLGSRLGPILVQLPQGAHCDLYVLEKFLDVIQSAASSNMRFAFEFRHKSWLNDKVYNLLQRYKCGFVISDSARWPTEIINTADFAYVRLHGKPRMFYTLYSKEQLREWMKKIQSLKIKTAYIYFNNTMRGHAAENALMLKKMV